MRLINTATLELEEFEDEKPGQYAILSHRWGNQEVSYQDFLENRKRGGEGFQKIERFCALAASTGHKWAWVDTCCIDKKSSAELSEAINSMFRYYAKAAVCYAYLSDVATGDAPDNWLNSTWFQRGWTLQELLAPSNVHFFNHSWEFIGLKSTHSKSLAQVTGISHHCLTSRKSMYEASVACKMSWASQRETTRREDMAYCLLGLFDVNMPLLYGEGKKAFMRLQLEIIRKSDDESIFAWEYDLPQWGLLAPSPRAFQNSCNVKSSKGRDSSLAVSRHISPEPYGITNKGLELRKALQRLCIQPGVRKLDGNTMLSSHWF